MRVGDWMTQDVPAVDPATSAVECRQRMRDGSVRCLPVVDDGALVGRVTDVAAFGRHPAGATVADLISPAPLIVLVDEPLADVLARCAWSMQDTVFVVDRGQLVGVLTEHDAVRHAASELPVQLRVRDWANASPTTIDADVTVQDALQQMKRWFVRHLVVLDGGRLVRVLSLRDVLIDQVDGSLSPDDRRVRRVRDLTPQAAVWTTQWNVPLRQAAQEMVEHGVGCLPVVADDDPQRVQGVITRSDLVRAMVDCVLREDPCVVGVQP